MIHIRPAVSDDAPALLDIYAPYVIETAITFEYEVPTLDDFRQRIKNTLHTHPWLCLLRHPAHPAVFPPQRSSYRCIRRFLHNRG